MAGGHEGHDHWHVVHVDYDAEPGRGMGASAVPAQRGAVGVQPCHHVAAQRGAVQPFSHVVADRRPRQRARVAASTVCAGLLVAASVAVGRGWASRAVLHEEQVLDARIVFPAGARPAAITPAIAAARAAPSRAGMPQPARTRGRRPRPSNRPGTRSGPVPGGRSKPPPASQLRPR